MMQEFLEEKIRTEEALEAAVKLEHNGILSPRAVDVYVLEAMDAWDDWQQTLLLEKLNRSSETSR